MTRLAHLSAGALLGLLHTRTLADAADTPPGQHAFLAIRVERGEESPEARFPVHVAGADRAYEAAEKVCEAIRKPRAPGVYGVNAYVLEVYAPEDIEETLSTGERPMPDAADDLTTPDGPVAVCDTSLDGPDAVVARFALIADAEDFLSLSAGIDPDKLAAGVYSIDAPHGLGADSEAVAAAKRLGFDVFWSVGSVYYAPPGVAVSGNVSGKGWKGSYESPEAAALAALATVDPS